MLEKRLLRQVIRETNQWYDDNYEKAEAVLSACHQVTRKRDAKELVHIKKKFEAV